MGPLYQKDEKKLESIQRRATKLISKLKDKSYEESLRELELPSLVYRRRRGDMNLMFKGINGFVRVDISILFTPIKLGYTRGHTQKVYKHHAVKAARANTFIGLNDWNALPNYVVKAPSLNLFKTRLDEHWQDIHYTIAE